VPIVSVHRGCKVYQQKKFRPKASIHDIVMAFNPETKCWEMPTVCLLNNAPVLRKDWKKTRIKENDSLVFAMLPLGGRGGSNPLQVIATVAVAMVSVWAGPVLAAAMGFAATGVAASLFTGGLMMIGGLLLGQIFPTATTRASTAEAASPTYTIGAANNQARLYEPEPESFGRMKIVCDLASQAWPIYGGNNQYLHQVFAIGRGYYVVERISLGDTMIWNNTTGTTPGYDLQLQFGQPGDQITLFPNNVEVSSEVAGQQLLGRGQAGWDFVGPYSVCSPGVRVNRIINNVVWPGGGGRYNSDGKYRQLVVHVHIQARQVDDYDNPLEDWFDLQSHVFGIQTVTAQRMSYDNWVNEGRYQVRARRYDNQTEYGDRAWHTCQWENMMGFVPGTISYNISTVAVRLKATDEVSAVASNQLSIICTRSLPIYNRYSKTWGWGTTRLFAAAVSQVARADYAGGLSDDRIDLDTLWQIGEEIDAKGWSFDGYFDSYYTVWQLIMQMCSPFGVIPRVSGGRLTFAHDKAGRPVRHIFTPESIVRGSFSITYNTFTDNSPDDVDIEYLDEAYGFQTRNVRAVLPDSESRQPASKNFIGVVKRRQAFYMGVRLAAANRHRRLEFKFQTEGAGRLISPGDIAVINHPYLATTHSGFIKSADEANLSFGVTLDASALTGDQYLALTGRDGKPWGPCKVKEIITLNRNPQETTIYLDSADYTIVVAQYNAAGRSGANPFEWISPAWIVEGQNGRPTVWSLESGANYENRVIIQAVNTVDRFHYEITAINDADEAYGYTTLPVTRNITATPYLAVPDWSGPTFNTERATLDAPIGFTARGLGSIEEPILELNWLPVPGATTYFVEYSVDGETYIRLADVYANSTNISVSPGEIYIRVAGRNRERQGDWGSFETTTDDLYYPAVEFELVEAYTGASLHIDWPESEYGAINYVVSIMPSAGAVVRSASTGLETAYRYTPIMGQADGGPWRELAVRLETVYPGGLTRSFESAVYDPAPVAPIDIDVEITTVDIGSIILENIILFNQVDNGEETTYHTGFIVAYGLDEQNLNNIEKFATAPFFIKDTVASTTYYFKVAIKDAFYDFTQNLNDLNFSDIMSITTGA